MNRYMANKAIALFGVFSLLAMFSQAQIDENLRKANWKPGKEKIIYGNSVVRLEGKNDISGVLNLGYQTLNQLKNEIETIAEKEMWSKEKIEEEIALYEKLASGGMIHIFLTRLTIDAANTDNFTVIVRDSTDSKEIFRSELESSIPNTPMAGNYWWNYAVLPISTRIEGTMFVYVIDKLGRDNHRFKYEIKL